MINREVAWDASYGIIKLLMKVDMYNSKLLKLRTLIISRVNERTKHTVLDVIYLEIMEDTNDQS